VPLRPGDEPVDEFATADQAHSAGLSMAGEELAIGQAGDADELGHGESELPNSHPRRGNRVERAVGARQAFRARTGFQSAVITEEKPPRAFQSATMVRRRGLRHLPRSSQILFVAASKKMPSLRNEWK